MAVVVVPIIITTIMEDAVREDLVVVIPNHQPHSIRMVLDERIIVVVVVDEGLNQVVVGVVVVVVEEWNRRRAEVEGSNRRVEGGVVEAWKHQRVVVGVVVEGSNRQHVVVGIIITSWIIVSMRVEVVERWDPEMMNYMDVPTTTNNAAVQEDGVTIMWTVAVVGGVRMDVRLDERQCRDNDVPENLRMVRSNTSTTNTHRSVVVG